jgi:hypothetical protein
MRSALLCIVLGLLAAGAGAAGKLYKHVDEHGNVTYTDVPVSSKDEKIKPKPPNVTSSEATYQLYQAEIEAQMNLMRRGYGSTGQPSTPAYIYRGYVRDPALPPTPPVDSNRRYYY